MSEVVILTSDSTEVEPRDIPIDGVFIWGDEMSQPISPDLRVKTDELDKIAELKDDSVRLRWYDGQFDIPDSEIVTVHV